MKTEPYLQQADRWPQSGRHILAQYDDASVIVYQAYPSIARHAIPDHDPSGARLERRAIQIGLRGEIFREYATSELLDVIAMMSLVAEQRPNATRARWAQLQTPEEHVYRRADPTICANVGLD